MKKRWIAALTAGVSVLVGLVVHAVKRKPRVHPRFDHDCSRCVFLGHCDYTYEGRLLVSDLYACDSQQSALGPSFIARFGSKGPDYASMPAKLLSNHLFMMPHGSALLVAQQRWEARN